MRHFGDNPETSIWISTTDLMSGLLVIFLFISILMTQATDEAKEKLQKAQDQIQKVTSQANLAEQNIKSKISENFSAKDQEKYGLNQNGLASARFPDGTGTFQAGSFVLTEAFKRELNYFLPRYLKAISESDQQYIKEIRIEGHTSSEWDTGGVTSPEIAYMKNMELSQQRTLSILLYALEMPELAPYRSLIQQKMRATGYSSSDLVLKEGKEDREASRRIEFRIIANDAATINNIKEAMSK